MHLVVCILRKSTRISHAGMINEQQVPRLRRIPGQGSVCMSDSDGRTPPLQHHDPQSWLYQCMAISESEWELLSHVNVMPRMCIFPSASRMCLICLILVCKRCTFHSYIFSPFGIALASEDAAPGTSPCDELEILH